MNINFNLILPGVKNMKKIISILCPIMLFSAQAAFAQTSGARSSGSAAGGSAGASAGAAAGSTAAAAAGGYVPPSC